MPKFFIEAERFHEYEIQIEADSEEDALDKIKDWIADDFEEYEVNAHWKFGVWEMD